MQLSTDAVICWLHTIRLHHSLCFVSHQQQQVNLRLSMSASATEASSFCTFIRDGHESRSLLLLLPLLPMPSSGVGCGGWRFACRCHP